MMIIINPIIIARNDFKLGPINGIFISLAKLLLKNAKTPKRIIITPITNNKILTVSINIYLSFTAVP